MSTDEIMQGTKPSLKVADGSSVDDGGKKSGMVADAGGGQSDVADDDYDLWCEGLLAQRPKQTDLKESIELKTDDDSQTFNSLIQSSKAQQVSKFLWISTNIAFLGAVVIFSQSYPEIIYYLGNLPYKVVLQIFTPTAVVVCILMAASIFAMRKKTACQAEIQVASQGLAAMTIPMLLAIIIMPAMMHLTADTSLSQDEKLRMAYSLISLDKAAAPKLLKSIAAKSTTSLNDIDTSRILYANYLLMINSKRANHPVDFRKHVDRIVEILANQRSMPPLKLTALDKQCLLLSRESVAKSVIDYLRESNDPDQQKLITQILKSTARFESTHPGKRS